MSDTCILVNGITRHVFWGPDARTCLCGGKTVVLDDQGRVIDEAVVMTQSELEHLWRGVERGR